MIMVVAFHAGAYFYLRGRVLLYFIVWVEVMKIQIWFEFKLVQNLEKIWKFKSLFQFFIGHGPNSTQPAQLSLPFLSHGWPALWPMKPISISAEPSSGLVGTLYIFHAEPSSDPAASSSPSKARRLHGGVTKPERLTPIKKSTES
jgi:hypothetical protein